jgi:hypothetical protein
MLTEYQEQFYNEMGQCIVRHMMENDLTPVEVVGIIDLVKTEVREETLMCYHAIEVDGDEDRGF